MLPIVLEVLHQQYSEEGYFTTRSMLAWYLWEDTAVKLLSALLFSICSLKPSTDLRRDCSNSATISKIILAVVIISFHNQNLQFCGKRQMTYHCYYGML